MREAGGSQQDNVEESVLFFLNIYLCLVVLGLLCCVWIFSSWEEQGLLSSCRMLASQRRLQALEHKGFSSCRRWAQ